MFECMQVFEKIPKCVRNCKAHEQKAIGGTVGGPLDPLWWPTDGAINGCW